MKKREIAGCPSSDCEDIIEDEQDDYEKMFTSKEISIEEKKLLDELEEGIGQSHKPSKLYDLSSNDVINVLTLKGNEFYHVERINCSYSNELSEMCQASKKLRNLAVFISRQIYFLTQRENYTLNTQFPDVAKKVYSFMQTKLNYIQAEELRKKLFDDPSLKLTDIIAKKIIGIFKSRNGLIEFLKFENIYEEVSKIHSQVPQQIIGNVADAWKGYKNALAQWKINPNLFPNGKRPNIPHYGRKFREFAIIFPDQPFKTKRTTEHYIKTRKETVIKNKGMIKKYHTGELLFPKNTKIKAIRTRILPEQVTGIRIIPRGNIYIFEIIYAKKKNLITDLIPDRIVSIDIGLNILMTIVNNFGKPPILIRGDKIKTDNQLMNKMITKLKSDQMKGHTPLKKNQLLPETMDMKRIRSNRNNRINDSFHKASHFLIEYCINHKISKIVIGYNKYWKSGIKLRKTVTQNFVFIPFHKLIQKIKYKAEVYGIKVILINESHTSKCSALDYEPIQHHNTYLGTRGPSIRGRGKDGEGIKYYQSRGLFKASDGTMIHSDVNGAFNIGRKAFPIEFGRTYVSTKSMLIQPIVSKI